MGLKRRQYSVKGGRVYRKQDRDLHLGIGIHEGAWYLLIERITESVRNRRTSILALGSSTGAWQRLQFVGTTTWFPKSYRLGYFKGFSFYAGTTKQFHKQFGSSHLHLTVHCLNLPLHLGDELMLKRSRNTRQLDKLFPNFFKLSNLYCSNPPTFPSRRRADAKEKHRPRRRASKRIILKNQYIDIIQIYIYICMIFRYRYRYRKSKEKSEQDLELESQLCPCMGSHLEPEFCTAYFVYFAFLNLAIVFVCTGF